MEKINFQIKLIIEKKSKSMKMTQIKKDLILNKILWLKFNIIGLREYINILTYWREFNEKRKIKIQNCRKIINEQENKLNRVLKMKSLENIKKIAVNNEKTLRKIQDTAKNSENATYEAQKTTKLSLILITFGTIGSIIVMITSIFPYLR